MEPQYVTKAALRATELTVSAHMRTTELDLTTRMKQLETTLLKEFRESTLRLDAIVRMSSVEKKADDLENAQP